jgi:hypothetical protein
MGRKRNKTTFKQKRTPISKKKTLKPEIMVAIIGATATIIAALFQFPPAIALFEQVIAVSPTTTITPFPSATPTIQSSPTSINFIQTYTPSSDIKITLAGLQDYQLTGGLIRFQPEIESVDLITRLDIAIDDSILVTISSAPFEYVWNSTDIEPGLHNFTFIATDSNEHLGYSTLILNIQPPLIIDITQPSHGDILQKSTSISATVSSLPDVYIGRVEFFIDGNLIETLNTPPYKINLDTSSVPYGSHIITVSAFDEKGLFNTQDNVEVKNISTANAPTLFAILIFIPGIVLILVAFVIAAKRNNPVRGRLYFQIGTTIIAEISIESGWNVTNLSKRTLGTYPSLGLKWLKVHKSKLQLECVDYLALDMNGNNYEGTLMPESTIPFAGEMTIRYEPLEW